MPQTRPWGSPGHVGYHMKRGQFAGVLAAGALLAIGVATPANAGADIGWTWNNNGDKDVKAKFVHNGENIHAVENDGNTYVEYNPPGSGGHQVWYVPGSATRSEKVNNLSYDEGLTFTMQVCESKTAAPDDCSAWKTGTT